MDRAQIAAECELLAKRMGYFVNDEHRRTGLIARVCERFVCKPPKDGAEVDLAFLEEYHAQRAAPCPTQKVAYMLFKDKVYGDEEDWISFEQTLAVVAPSLERLHFIDRSLGALKILGWEYPSIALQYNAVLPSVSLENLNSRDFLALVKDYVEFRRQLCEQLCRPTQQHCQWLKRLLEAKDHWKMEEEATTVMARFLEQLPGSRFGRGVGKDRFAALRDRWKGVKEFLVPQLNPGMFVAKCPPKQVKP